MADLYASTVGSTTFGANARKSEEPFYRFGTPDIAFHKITGVTGVGTNPDNANSVFHQAVRAVQEVAEVYFAKATATNVMVIGITANTNNGGGVGNTANDKTIANAIDTALSLSVTVGAADSAVFQTS